MNIIDTLYDNEDLSTDEGIEAICEKIKNLNSGVNGRLDELLGRQSKIERQMNNIGRSLAGLNVANDEANKVNSMVENTSSLAENVSAKVRRLDEARKRVSECQQRVHDLIDLQVCSQGVIAAIKSEDFEKGAGHINRFLSMDEKLLQRTADDVSGSITSVNRAFNTLTEATTQLRQIINKKFDEAVAKDDLASVERFFKIFPLLGKHQDGIEKFAGYICVKLEKKSQKELRNSLDMAKADNRVAIAYADVLTLLFENFARVMEVNQPIIENYYGYGYLIDLFRILQRECDSEVKKTIAEFNKNRHIQRHMQKINDFQKSSGQQGLGHFRKPSGGSVDKLNPKDIDGLLIEITVMHARAELYIKFMRRRITNDVDKTLDPTESAKIVENNLKTFEEIVSKSVLSVQMQELLGTYLLFEGYFMEESILKAIALDTFEPGQKCSNVVDDVFFIIRKSIRRSIETQSIDGVCAVINNAATSLEEDFVSALKTPLKNGYPSGYIDLAQAYNAFQTSIQQGKLQTNDNEQSRANFIVQLNNADMSTEFIETLTNSVSEDIRCAFPRISPKVSGLVESCLAGMKSVRDTLKAVVDFGLQQLRSTAIKPRLHTWIDQFISLNHTLTDEELANYEAGETFAHSLIHQLDTLLKSFQNVMNSRNYDALVSIVATDATARLERAIKKSSFNRLGGLVLDQEVRALGSYLTAATSWSVRDKMIRLTQIATLLNLEKLSEVQEYLNPGEQEDRTTWRLTTSEVRTILALRVDFKMDEIKRLKFN
ncbi:conserved oligomeric Golgi complex subunit 4 [Sitodiplosis mosellana]|uniref:conserved oligomeric Golgi complex subunit 4 n=1 Tax=Sitodiplosis mosellana TaxID=263140 RepID=UPI0024452B20|nr:conserved oligomeric Golgi complex subunit 4 [Sitodiplosis mosellana]